MRPVRLKPRRSGPAIVVSLAVHILALAAVLLSVRLPRPPAEPPAVQVSLIDIAPAAPLLRLPPPTSRPLSPRPAPAPPVDAPPPPRALSGAAERQPQAPSPAPERGERPPYLSFYQDALKGCEREALMLLPAAEQERCRARIAAASVLKGGPFRGAAPALEALSTLTAARRAALDAEVERRERAGGPMGKAPVSTCEGRLNNLGAGCLPNAAD